MGRFITPANTIHPAEVYTKRCAPARTAPEPKPFPHAMGYYNADGSWHQQMVRLGRTQSGQGGLFTCGTLAWPLKDSDYWPLSSDRRVLKAYVERLGFMLEPFED